jgi:hypothetical protein
MCFTLPGRIQTRAVTLVNVLLLAMIFTGMTGNFMYFDMFFRMVAVTFVLDVFVYSKLIDFQPRWLTILLGVLEFFILVLVAPWPVNTIQMLGFYIPAWGLSWLTIEIILPLVWLRWMEDGGEFRRI